MPFALTSLIKKTEEDKELLNQILSSFSCELDKDIENFLQNKAVQFEELSKARTYLICSQKQVESENFCLDQLNIYGYFSLALKVLSIPDDFSNRKRMEIDGLSAKIYGKPINDFPCYLIGQLAKNSNIDINAISGDELLQSALNIISNAVKAVGGRYVMIECHNNDKLINFYKRNGFVKISNVFDKDNEMLQMIRKI